MSAAAPDEQRSAYTCSTRREGGPTLGRRWPLLGARQVLDRSAQRRRHLGHRPFCPDAAVRPGPGVHLPRSDWRTPCGRAAHLAELLGLKSQGSVSFASYHRAASTNPTAANDRWRTGSGSGVCRRDGSCTSPALSQASTPSHDATFAICSTTTTCGSRPLPAGRSRRCQTASRGTTAGRGPARGRTHPLETSERATALSAGTRSC